MTAKKRLLFLAADHAGFALKEALKQSLPNSVEVHDLSPKLIEGDDYPAVAKLAAKAVLKYKAEALLVCGTGLGMDIAANRLKGIRAVVVRTPKEAKLSREHNHANILILGGRLTKKKEAEAITKAWLRTPFSTESRHVRRIKQLDT